MVFRKGNREPITYSINAYAPSECTKESHQPASGTYEAWSTAPNTTNAMMGFAPH